MTKAADLKTKTKDELQKMLLDLRKEQFNLRFQATTGQMANTARVRAIRRDIARVSTLLTKPALSPKTKAKAAGKASGKKKAA